MQIRLEPIERRMVAKRIDRHARRVVQDPAGDAGMDRRAVDPGPKPDTLNDAANPDPKVVDSFLAAVGDKTNQPVYIHCGSANRVGAVWMIKRALKDGWDVDKAREEAEAIGLTNARLKTFATEYIATHKK